MRNKNTKFKAMLFVVFMASMALVGTMPMIMGYSTDGGGSSYNWNSATSYPTSAFSAHAYMTGSMDARKTTAGSYGRVDSHLTKYYTAPATGYVVIKISYQWNWYTDVYNYVHLGTSGLKNPSGHYASDRLVLIDGYNIIGPVVSEYENDYTYMHIGYVSIFIPVSSGVRYSLTFDLTIQSGSAADAFHLIGNSAASATFKVTNQFTFYSSIP